MHYRFKYKYFDVNLDSVLELLKGVNLVLYFQRYALIIVFISSLLFLQAFLHGTYSTVDILCEIIQFT